MANAITKFKKYVPMLDEVYKVASVTSVLDGDSELVQMGANANEIIIPKISMQGLGDYSRNDGYVSGDVVLTNETVTFNYDRGRKFTVDAMDNEETAGLAFGKLASEFVRTQTAPEADAFRFATYAQTAHISAASPAILNTGDEVLTAVNAGVSKMDEDEVTPTGRILFITPTLYNKMMNVETYKSKDILDGFEKIVKVPQARFLTQIKLNNGKMDEAKGGYEKAPEGKNINFMIVQKDAVLQYPKHVVNKAITPEDNQESDGWAFYFRSYGLADVYENKAAGIYLHASTDPA